MKNQERSAYRDWYYCDSFPLVCERGKKPNYRTFGYHGGMPKLNLQNPATAEYFIQVGRYWIENCHISSGMSMCKIRWNTEAPSIFAASYSPGSTFARVAR